MTREQTDTATGAQRLDERSAESLEEVMLLRAWDLTAKTRCPFATIKDIDIFDTLPLCIGKGHLIAILVPGLMENSSELGMQKDQQLRSKRHRIGAR